MKGEIIGYYRRPNERNWHRRIAEPDARRFTALCGQSLHLDSGFTPYIHFRTNEQPPSAGHICRYCKREERRRE